MTCLNDHQNRILLLTVFFALLTIYEVGLIPWYYMLGLMMFLFLTSVVLRYGWGGKNLIAIGLLYFIGSLCLSKGLRFLPAWVSDGICMIPTILAIFAGWFGWTSPRLDAHSFDAVSHVEDFPDSFWKLDESPLYRWMGNVFLFIFGLPALMLVIDALKHNPFQLFPALIFLPFFAMGYAAKKRAMQISAERAAGAGEFIRIQREGIEIRRYLQTKWYKDEYHWDAVNVPWSQIKSFSRYFSGHHHSCIEIHACDNFTARGDGQLYLFADYELPYTLRSSHRYLQAALICARRLQLDNAAHPR